MSHKLNNTKILNLDLNDLSNKKIQINGQNMPGIALVFVWASYCGHCLHAIPAISSLANRHNINTVIGNHSVTIVAAQGDSKDPTERQILAALQSLTSIRGYPTILIFKNGEFLGQYNGDRSADAIDSYLKSI